MFAPRERAAVRPDATCGGVRDLLSPWSHWHLCSKSRPVDLMDYETFEDVTADLPCFIDEFTET
jgi:hypothetical protein